MLEPVRSRQKDVAINLRTLVSRAADDLLIGILHQYLQVLSDPSGSSLAHELVRQICYSGTASLDFLNRMLSIQPTGLRTFLSRIAEDPDPIQLRRGKKLAEHIEIGLGLILFVSGIYAFKKTWDTDAASQLFHKSDEVLKQVLSDPEMESWHRVAKKLLKKRGSYGDPYQHGD